MRSKDGQRGFSATARCGGGVLSGIVLPMKSGTHTNTEETTNGRPLVNSVPTNHPIIEETTNGRPLISSPHSNLPIAEESSNAALPLIHAHTLAAAAEPTTGSAAAPSAKSARPRC